MINRLIYNKIVLLFIVFFSITGCEKEIEIEFPEHKSNMVVEGWIEQNTYAKVILSLSAPFFAPIDSNSIFDFAVTHARVKLTTNDQSEILTLKKNENYFPPYFYFSTDIKGKAGFTYNLEISYGGKIFTATTSIPKVIETDSVWFEKNTLKDTFGLIGIKFTDPIEETNYYRTLAKVKGKDKIFIPTLTSVYSDQAFNGETLQLTLSKGSANILEVDESRNFSVGDTILLKFCSIDKAQYEFWNTMQNQALTSANPFSVSHEEIMTNISDGFGIWGGYAAHYDTIIAK